MITKITQRALAPPPMSWLRKMSPNTVMSNQIQMKNMKNQSIDQSTWPVPKSARTMGFSSLGARESGTDSAYVRTSLLTRCGPDRPQGLTRRAARHSDEDPGHGKKRRKGP